jgi:hypothetical protein
MGPMRCAALVIGALVGGCGVLGTSASPHREHEGAPLHCDSNGTPTLDLIGAPLVVTAGVLGVIFVNVQDENHHWDDYILPGLVIAAAPALVVSALTGYARNRRCRAALASAPK